MPDSHRIPTAFLLLLLIPSAATAQVDENLIETWRRESQSGDEFALPISRKRAAEIDGLIAQLVSPVYQVRQSASERLVDIGAVALGKLRVAYRTVQDLEVRLRIEEIARAVYLDYHVYRRNAFLGISQRRVALTHADDPRIAKGRYGIQIANVIADTAASEAGLQVGDVIIALDAVPLAVDRRSGALAFGELIRRRHPGTAVSLAVLRGSNELSVRAVLRPRPRRHYGPYQGSASKMLSFFNRAFESWWSTYFPRQQPTSGTNKTPTR